MAMNMEGCYIILHRRVLFLYNAEFTSALNSWKPSQKLLPLFSTIASFSFFYNMNAWAFPYSQWLYLTKPSLFLPLQHTVSPPCLSDTSASIPKKQLFKIRLCFFQGEQVCNHRIVELEDQKLSSPTSLH